MNEITGNFVILLNTLLLVILGLVQIIKTFIDHSKSKKNATNNDLDFVQINELNTKVDKLVEKVDEIKEVLEQEKIIESMSKMAVIQKATLEMLNNQKKIG